MNATPPSFASLGHLACLVQLDVPQLRELLDSLDVPPAYLADGVPWYPSDVIERVRQHLAGKRTRRRAPLAAARQAGFPHPMM